MKLTKLMLAMVLVLVAVLALASCGCEHIYDEAITTQPTCTAEGVKTFTCSLCGDSYTEVVPTGDHRYIETATRPTCTEPGVKTYNCKDCGHSYTEEIESAKGHDYVETVVAATCSTTGYTGYTCSVCGDTRKDNETDKDPNAHTFKTTIVELTAEQAAANPLAIGVEKSVCTSCGLEPEVDTAVLMYMDFETVPNVATYEGSDAYKNFVASHATINDDQKAFLAYWDAQQNTDILAEAWGQSQANLITEGKLKATNAPTYMPNTLGLSSSAPAAATYTLSFDIVINVTGKQDKKLLDATQFFAFADNKKYNNRTIILALNNTDVDTNPGDEVYTYELVAASYKDGIEKAKAATGFYVTLGKEYTFKLVVDSAAKMYELYAKEAGAAEFVYVGAYEYAPHATSRVSCFVFALSSVNSGNLIDNLKVTTALVK